jgi:D-lactate dehydrogenase
MKVAFFSSKPYDEKSFRLANEGLGHDLKFFEARLSTDTVTLAEGYSAVCPFVNDVLDAEVLRQLTDVGIGLVALRCAGYNNVDLAVARTLGLAVTRVPAYSPHAVAEHAMGLILSLNRKIHRANNRVHDGNFSLDGLLGFDLVMRTAGVVGTGKIGAVMATILRGFGMKVLAVDAVENEELKALGVQYVSLERLIEQSDIITLHVPQTSETHHLINAHTISRMKRGVMLINTSRGGLLDTPAVVDGLKTGKIGYLGLDVYEEEADIFFENLSEKVLMDDVLARLLSFPNVLITGHQAFLTREALSEIAQTTLGSVSAFEKGQPLQHSVL